MTLQARKHLTRLTLTTALVATALCGSFSADAAGYVPGAYVGNVPTGSFPKVLTSATLGPLGGSLTTRDSQGTVSLTVPRNAFPGDTHSRAGTSSPALRTHTSSRSVQIALYAPNRTLVTKLLPRKERFIDAVAIGWSTAGKAAKKLRLTLTSRLITGKTRVFRTTRTGVQPVRSASVKHGRVTLRFNRSEGIVVANPAGSK